MIDNLYSCGYTRELRNTAALRCCHTVNSILDIVLMKIYGELVWYKGKIPQTPLFLW